MQMLSIFWFHFTEGMVKHTEKSENISSQFSGGGEYSNFWPCFDLLRPFTIKYKCHIV